MDLTAMTDTELNQLFTDVVAEQERRRVLASTQEQMQVMNTQYLEASGVAPGQSWRQPAGAHDAYPEGWVVVHNGKTWVSLTPANVWEPGVSAWREVIEEPTDPAPAPEWVQPTGVHDAYNVGDRVTFNGVVYESTTDNNTWAPADYPQGWIVVV